jgi:hypothetical protein
MVGRTWSVIYVVNPSLTGFFRLDKDSQSGFFAVHTIGDTSKPEASNAAADVSEAKLVELLRGQAFPGFLLSLAPNAANIRPILVRPKPISPGDRGRSTYQPPISASAGMTGWRLFPKKSDFSHPAV